MSSQLSPVPSDILPPYSEECAPPSYTEAEADLHVQQSCHIPAPAPAALDVSTRIREIAPPVQTSRTLPAIFPSRTPFKHSTRPGRGYTRTAVSHTAIDMPEPDLTTLPMRYFQTNIRTTASGKPCRRRIALICSCIVLLFLVALIASLMYIGLAKGKGDSANTKASGTSVSTGGSLNHDKSPTNCGFLYFNCWS
jgi:hypothetical protein